MPDAGLFDLALFLAATFAAAMVAGMAGFAFGLVAAAVWLHVLSPLQTTTLIVTFGLIVQGYSVWKLRHALKPKRLWPFLLGGALGLPLGVELLRWLPAADVRIAVGVFLVLFSLWSLARPALRHAFRSDHRRPPGCQAATSRRLGRIPGYPSPWTC